MGTSMYVRIRSIKACDFLRHTVLFVLHKYFIFSATISISSLLVSIQLVVLLSLQLSHTLCYFCSFSFTYRKLFSIRWRNQQESWAIEEECIRFGCGTRNTGSSTPFLRSSGYSVSMSMWVKEKQVSILLLGFNGFAIGLV